MSATARLVLDPAFAVGAADPRLFGSFVEHMGRAVYGGIYEPGHATADEHGFRRDVIELVRELGVTVVRYPGGNFVSAYDWEDGVGPRAGRPTRLDLAWRSIESNEVGTDEFMRWAAEAGVEPYLAVNLGTRGIDAARAYLEYVNGPPGTTRADLRAANGHPEPYGVRLWCLGNEMDGPWQIGQKDAGTYGRLAAEAGKAMRAVDPAIELVACGSSNSGMPTFGAWEDAVLDEAWEVADHVSLHTYYDPADHPSLGSYLACSRDLDRMIGAVAATSDAVAARRRERRRPGICVDEWNVWHQAENPHARPGAEPVRAPAIAEDDQTLADALVVGCLLITLLRHADRVAIACLAQLVNVLGPIRTLDGGPAWRQTTFHPFAQAARFARGTVLRVEPTCGTYAVDGEGDVPLLEATAVLGDGALTLFAVNRGEEPMALEAVLRDLAGAEPIEHLVLDGDDPQAVNTPDAERVRPRRAAPPRVEEGVLRAELPPRSWNVVRVGVPASSS